MACDELITDGQSPITEARVASYDSMHGAMLATEQLVERGFRREEVRVIPADLRPLPGWRERLTRRPHGLAMVSASTFTLVVAGILLDAVTVLSSTFAWTIALVLAAVIGGLAWAADVAMAAATRRAARAERRVVATRFEVTCRHDIRRAERTLARWWDPAAPPARVDRGTHLAA